ncbi:MAG: hypothetical protein HY553_20270, partial [Elusimicrobia bacterium]|nr:hypothetical protein [Elusimicrobiota bacterium]
MVSPVIMSTRVRRLAWPCLWAGFAVLAAAPAARALHAGPMPTLSQVDSLNDALQASASDPDRMNAELRGSFENAAAPDGGPGAVSGRLARTATERRTSAVASSPGATQPPAPRSSKKGLAFAAAGAGIAALVASGVATAGLSLVWGALTGGGLKAIFLWSAIGAIA